MGSKNVNLLRNRYPNTFEVYLIGTIDDKPLYAGQGQCGHRAQEHLSYPGCNKYNLKPSELKILHRVIVATKQEALELEERFIEKFKPKFNIYKHNNATRKLHTHSEESKIKMSKAHKGKIMSEASKKKMSDFRLGSHLSEEIKQKISASLTGKTFTAERKQKISEGLKRRSEKRNEK